MKDLLFLVHRIPFPPNKGDKIRSYHLLKHLTGNFRVHLGTFIDDENDWEYVDKVDSWCASSHILRLRPGLAKLRSLGGLLTREPLSIPYYRNRSMQNWVDDTIDRFDIRNILVFSSAMAQFVPSDFEGSKLIDFVDADSDKWRQYARGKSWPATWIYKREADYLLEFERAIAQQFDQSFFVSEAEASLFKEWAPESRDRILFFNNGVDTDYFSPDRDYPNPYGDNHPRLVFTGAMDYWANVDAVVWFTESVFPLIKKFKSDMQFYIVGSNPTNDVKALEQTPGVVVTGRVDDIRPYLHHASASVASLRIARGIQNKVLEAMAMKKPILATEAAIEGIPVSDKLDTCVSDLPERLAEHAVALFDGSTNIEVSCANREFVLMNYSWSQNLKKLEPYLSS